MDFARLTRFLADLAENNERAWFEAHRAEYEALRGDFGAFVAEVIADIARWDDTVRWVDPKDCIYRIYRDVRFSGDKTPYKTTFSAVISERGRRGHGPSYYFQVDRAGTLMAGGGVWMPTPERLARIREHIAEHPEQLQRILKGRTFRAAFGGLWEGHTLKRPPSGYSADAPLIDAIKLKSFIVERERETGAPAGELRAWIAESFRAMHPFILWLRGAVAGAADQEA
ncbi:MAG TPA: DUF2461 domain-containing protein [Longimicrobiaceae bacterium]|nr:DUF2461 domain-containing protein [Longimicrobiaceae bacterium]